MRIKLLALIYFTFYLISCSIPSETKYEFTLKSYSTLKNYSKHKLPAIYISAPEAVVGFQTNEMLYTKVPYEINSYSKNVWANPPAEMLYPLILQSFQESQAFRVVSSGTHAEITHFRLDIQLLEFMQIFSHKHSSIHLTMKAMITDTNTAKLLSTKVFKIIEPCPFNTPYGGVIAANSATKTLTYQLIQYTIKSIRNTARI